MRKVMFAVLAGVLAVGGQMTAVKAEEHGARLTWLKGIVTIPGGGCLNRTIGDEDTRKDCLIPGPKNAKGKVPAVLFLHGCAGINQRQYAVMELFTKNGYATFMTDGLAHPDRSESCTGRNYVTAPHIDEINYALSEFSKIPWIDQKRLVLAGFSAGGITAAEYQDYDFAFKARVILGWSCQGGMTPTAVLVPFLNLVGKNDDETRWGAKLCSPSGDGTVVKLVSSGHDVSEDNASLAIIRDFLAKVLK